MSLRKWKAIFEACFELANVSKIRREILGALCSHRVTEHKWNIEQWGPIVNDIVSAKRDDSARQNLTRTPKGERLFLSDLLF